MREGDIHFCHGSPLNIEEFDYIFARDQAAQCLEIWDDLAPLTLIGHSHLCKSFALSPDGVHEVVSRSSSCARAGSTSSASARSASRATTIRAPATRSTTPTSSTFEFKRVDYDIKASAEKIFGADLEPNFGHRLFIGV